MDCRLLTGEHLDLSDYRFGTPQQFGCLTVVPITSAQSTTLFRPLPLSVRAKRRPDAAPILLANALEQSCVLAPLHFGLPVERGTSHFLSGTALVPPSEQRDLTGDTILPYSSIRHQRINLKATYCLPLALRGPVWRARHPGGQQRLIPALNDLQDRLRRLDLAAFPFILQAHQPDLKSFVGRIELLTGQTGALFFIDDRPVGLEIAPSAVYFAAIWEALLVGCYGLTALLHQYDSPALPSPEPYAISRLSELRTEMFRVRHQRQEEWEGTVAVRPEGDFKSETGQKWRNYRLHSLTGTAYAGQYIDELTTVQAEKDDGAGMPKMLRSLFRKASPTEETTRRRVVYASFFTLS
ncbi:MAG: hypothetical protein JWN14_78 [Chthonomonadales bacterium]|nr:hypothetical protein [Chthonomonadales bacterium]